MGKRKVPEGRSPCYNNNIKPNGKEGEHELSAGDLGRIRHRLGRETV